MISVIIPNYNHAPFLDLRITTVLNQNFSDFEVIILDDCSTDNSREVIERYRNHPKISAIVYNQTNSGSVFKQWIKGIDMANGEWILIAESDDWSEPSLLTHLYNATKKNSSITLSFCQTLTVFTNGDINVTSFAEQYNVLHAGSEFIKHRLINSRGLVTAGCALFKKDATKNMPDISAYKSAGDMKFWIYVASKGIVHETAMCLHYWRRHATNTTTNSALSISKIWELYETYFWAKNENYIDETKVRERCLFLVNILYRFKLLKNAEARIFLKEVKKTVAFPVLKVRLSGFCKAVSYKVVHFFQKKLLNVFFINHYK
jgi:glycosyltransferase involved in cell wall biosynthesis